MSVINRIEVANLLNRDHEKGTDTWNPIIAHEILDLGGHSTVFQMENGAGKTTIAEGLTALLSRNQKRMDVIQSRMAYSDLTSPSHVRMELIETKASEPDFLSGELDEPVKGIVWVLGMFGYHIGEPIFYSYRGTFDDAPVLFEDPEKGTVYYSELQFFNSLKNVTEPELEVSPDVWRKRIVNRHLEPEAVKELTSLAEQGGAEKAKDMFNVKATSQQAFDTAFFYKQVAPDLMDDLMTSEGEMEERRQAKRNKEKYISDAKFENSVLKSLLKIRKTENTVAEKKRDIKTHKATLSVLNQTSSVCDQFYDLSEEKGRILDECALNAKVLDWLWAGNMPGLPNIEAPDGPLGEIVKCMGLSLNREVVISHQGCALLFGKTTGHATERMMKLGYRNVDKEQVIEIYGDIKDQEERGHKDKWFKVSDLKIGISRTEKPGFGLSPDSAMTLLADAMTFVWGAFCQSNPLLEKIEGFTEEVERLENVHKAINVRFKDTLAAYSNKKDTHRSKSKEISAELAPILEQEKKHKLFEEKFRNKCPADVYANQYSEWQKLNAEAHDLKTKDQELQGYIQGLDKQVFKPVPAQNVQAVYTLFSNKGIEYTQVCECLDKYRSQIKPERFKELATLLGTVLLAPVLENASDLEKASSITVNSRIPMPLFLKSELQNFIVEGGHLTPLTDGAIVHSIFGAYENAVVKAFINPEEIDELKKQLLSQQVEISEKLGQLEDTLEIAKANYILAEAAKEFQENNLQDFINAKSEERALADAEAQKYEDWERELTIAQKDKGHTLEGFSEADKDMIREYRRITDNLQKVKDSYTPWLNGFNNVFGTVTTLQSRRKSAVKFLNSRLDVERTVDFDPTQEPAIKAALNLSEAISECLKTARDLEGICSAFRSKTEFLSMSGVKGDLDLVEEKLNLQLDKLSSIIKHALDVGGNSLPGLFSNALMDNKENPKALKKLILSFEDNVTQDEKLNEQTEISSDVIKAETVKGLASRIQKIRTRKKLLDRALEEGEGTSFEIHVTIPSTEEAEKVFSGLLNMARKTEKVIRAKHEEKTEPEIQGHLKKAIKGAIKETLMSEILIDPKVFVVHKKFNDIPKRLESPDPNNPSKFSNGENTSISLSWMIRKARYAREKGLINQGYKTSEVSRVRQNTSSFIILDGLFSDLSDEKLIRQAMEPLIEMRGEFQIFALVHAREYVQRHDTDIFKRLILGGINGGRWSTHLIGKDEFDIRKAKEGTWSLAHFDFKGHA